MMKKILIVCGEHSGDVYASYLAEKLLATGNFQIYAMGGHALEKAGARIIETIYDTAEVGFSEVVSKIPALYKKMSRLIKFCEQQNIDGVILTDFPDFNLRFAQKIRDKGIKTRIFYYIPPQVWLWRKNRIKVIKKLIDKTFLMYPFEKEIYGRNKVNHAYYGHPLMERLRLRDESSVKDMIGFMPGSRDKVFFKMSGIFRAVIEELSSKYPHFSLGIAVAGEKQQAYLRELLQGFNITFYTSAELLQKARAVVVASGTASLEAAVSGTPAVFVYKVSPVTFFIAHKIIGMNYGSLPNILLKKRVIPELLQKRCSKNDIIKEIDKLLGNFEILSKIHKDYTEIRELLGGGSVTLKIAEDIEKCLKI